MSVSYFVRYDIETADLQAFLRRYREVHVPLVARWPGLRRMAPHQRRVNDVLFACLDARRFRALRKLAAELVACGDRAVAQLA